jgi:peptide chain release factor 1
MFDRLDQLEERYEDLGRQLSDPTLVNDQKKFQTTAKQHRDLEPIVEKFRTYRKIKEGIEEAKAMLTDSDPDVKAMAEEELSSLEPRLAPVEEELKVLLLPKDPNDDKNVIIELRAGTGGDEAALFVAEVFRMYLRFAEQHRWKVEILSQSESGIGQGLKDVTAIFEGDKVYSQMKYESGVHRCSGFRRRRRRAGCIRRRLPWPCCQRLKKSTSRSSRRICGSTRSVLRDRAGSR